MKKICFIAQFPPPIHGLSKAVQTLYEANAEPNIKFEKIDIKNNFFFMLNIIKIIRSRADLFYFTISQTKGGNIRDLIILQLLKLRKKSYIIHLHGGSYFRFMVDNNLSKWQRKLNYNLISKAKKVIVLSKSLTSTFKGMIDENKIIIISNCVDDKFLLNKSEFKLKFQKITNKKIKSVLYLSNFIKEKGYEYVLELAKIEREEYEKNGVRNFKFEFAGNFFSKTDEKDFFNYIEKNGLNKYVKYHGVVDGNEKQKLLKQSDILILLTNYFREGQPISIIEGMGNGMAIVATNHTAIPDMIKDKVNGIIVDKNNIDCKKLYKKMKKIDFQKVCSNNYSECKKYSEKEYIKNCLDCFEDCLEESEINKK